MSPETQTAAPKGTAVRDRSGEPSDRVRDRRKHLADVGAQKADAADDDDRDQRGDQGIFQCRHTLLVTNQLRYELAHANLRFPAFRFRRIHNAGPARWLFYGTRVK